MPPQTDPTLNLYQEHSSEFEAYLQLLLKWNEKINLTAITRPEEIRTLHFLDSLTLLTTVWPYLFPNVSRETFNEDQVRKVIDIGAGGGFPGIPLKIAHPSLEMTLVDAVKKKCDFMKEVVRQLGLKGISVLHQPLNPKESIGSFDLVISRAAFKMSDLISLARPQMKAGGHLIAYKGVGIEVEINEANDLLKTLDWRPIHSLTYSLPSKEERQFLITGP